MGVQGIEAFREAMVGFESSYALIGGSACDLLLSDQGAEFRATKDLDIVVLTDGPVADFARAFWRFVGDGGYEPWRGRDEKIRFYRFVNPKSPGYPHMVELFARHPGFPLFDEESEIAPLPFDEDISSLSAILLDDDYYALLIEGLIVVDGISTLDEAHLILLKMRAHIDLNDRHEAGAHVNSADLKKHRKDVLRLLEFVPDDAALNLTDKIKADAGRFVSTVEDPAFRVDQLGLSLGRDEAVFRLRKLCGIER